MTDSLLVNAPKDHQTAPPSNSRRCLRCRDMFPSEWAGERVCPRCKKSAAWRNGAPDKSRRVKTGE